MSQSLSQIYLHIIFSTKHRAAYLQVDDQRNEMHAYVGGLLVQKFETVALQVGGIADHIHILTILPSTIKLSDFIGGIKRESSKWIKRRFSEQHDFQWQGGYGAFSVSCSNIDQVKTYILNQTEHHRTMSFQEEFRAFLDKHGYDYDEKYVWD